MPWLRITGAHVKGAEARVSFTQWGRRLHQGGDAPGGRGGPGGWGGAGSLWVLTFDQLLQHVLPWAREVKARDVGHQLSQLERHPAAPQGSGAACWIRWRPTGAVARPPR